MSVTAFNRKRREDAAKAAEKAKQAPEKKPAAKKTKATK